MIIDASDSILGRVCTVAAKTALKGEEVIVVNCEKAVITGRKKDIVSKYMQRFELGQPTQGPFFPRRPDMFVRRVIRGMLPRKRARGREAYKKVKCFMDMPVGLDQKDIKTIEEASIARSSTMNFMTVKELCRLIGR